MKQHRALNPFQFKDEPVTKQEESLIGSETSIPTEQAGNYPYGYQTRNALSLPNYRRTRLKIRLGRKW